MILFFMLVRWSWPRFRYDQLMALAWKVMLPLGWSTSWRWRSWTRCGTAWGLEGTLWTALLAAVVVGRVRRVARLAGACIAPGVADNRVRRFIETDGRTVMKPDDPHITVGREPRLGLAEKLYLPLTLQGLTTTLRHLAAR